jgi:hypothetical protein
MFRWLLPAVILVLALGVRDTSLPLVVQAQDGGSQSGQQAEMTYTLDVNMSGVNLDHFCLGSIAHLPVILSRRIQVDGETDVGRQEVLGTSFEVSSDNSAIVTVDYENGMPGISSNAVVNNLLLTAVSPGHASISVQGSLQTSQNDTDLYHAPISVEVVPCNFQVDLSSIWAMTISGASVLLHVSTTSKLALNPATGNFEDQPDIHWESTVNRIKGCLADHQAFNTLPGNGGSIQAQLRAMSWF